MSDFVQQNSSICGFTGSESWVILSPIELSIKHKIEKVGTPLKDWGINIYRGVLTGFNEAFIISGKKRQEILDNCKTDDERKRTSELIRPILRGRDIKRYGYNFANLYLINTHNGVKENGKVKIPRIDIADYPAIKAHLDQYWNDISTRADQGDTPYNLRNCAYLDDFFKQKICWKAVGRNLAYSIVEPGTFLTAPASFIQAEGKNEFILGFLCSNVGKYYVYKNSDTTGAGDIMLNIRSLIEFPIPKINDNNFVELVQRRLQSADINIESEIDRRVYELYGLSNEEIAFIESQQNR